MARPPTLPSASYTRDPAQASPSPCPAAQPHPLIREHQRHQRANRNRSRRTSHLTLPGSVSNARNASTRHRPLAIDDRREQRLQLARRRPMDEPSRADVRSVKRLVEIEHRRNTAVALAESFLTLCQCQRAEHRGDFICKLGLRQRIAVTAFPNRVDRPPHRRRARTRVRAHRG